MTRRACDQCHLRKLKCDGEPTCLRCYKKGKLCTYLKPVRPKGPAPGTKAQRVAGRSIPVDHDSQTSLSNPEPAGYGVGRCPNYNDPTVPIPIDASDRFIQTVPLSNPAKGGLPAGSAFNGEIWNAPFAETAIPELAGNVDGNTATGNIDLDQILALTPSFENQLITSAEQLVAWQQPESSTSFHTASAAFGTAGMPSGSMPIPSFGFSSMFNPSPLFPTPIAPIEDICPLLTLTLDTLIKPQLEIFFERIYSMMPVFTRSEILNRLYQPEAQQDKTFVSLILAMTALSLVHPLQQSEMVTKATRARQATMLLDESARLSARWDHGCGGTVEGVLTSYLMFGTLFELGYQDGARLRLREAISLGESMRLEQPQAYAGMGQVEARRRIRMFWILAVTERAYALQRSGHLVFDGTINTNLNRQLVTYPATVDTPGGNNTADTDPISHSLRHLALIFSYIDQNVISCWNGKCAGTTCTSLTASRVVLILRKLQGQAAEVFGEGVGEDLRALNETQRADLLITWQWIRNRVWRLAATHGLISPAGVGGPVELTQYYVLDIGAQTAEICRTLSYVSMEAHGTGFVEKLYDIASVLADVLRSIMANKDPASQLQAFQGMQTIQTLFVYVARHRAGTVDFAGRLGETVKASMKLLSSAG